MNYSGGSWPIFAGGVDDRCFSETDYKFFVPIVNEIPAISVWLLMGDKILYLILHIILIAVLAGGLRRRLPPLQAR